MNRSLYNMFASFKSRCKWPKSCMYAKPARVSPANIASPTSVTLAEACWGDLGLRVGWWALLGPSRDPCHAVACPCRASPCPALPLPCLAMPYHASPCPTVPLPCLAMPYHASPSPTVPRNRARLGSARLGWARQGSARLGWARQGLAGLGKARQGLAGLGKAWLGPARLGSRAAQTTPAFLPGNPRPHTTFTYSTSVRTSPAQASISIALHPARS